MERGPLYAPEYRPQFAGHETFPLRYGWLKKALSETQKNVADNNRCIFTGDDAIARFGVGKNMVASIRHWAKALNVISENNHHVSGTNFGKLLFGDDGLDPYTEHQATLWLMHWMLASKPKITAWYWAFNHIHQPSFDRDYLLKSLERTASKQGWPKVAQSTLKRDIECLLRMYVARTTGSSKNLEESFESPLAELGLIKLIGKRDGYRFTRGNKHSLPTPIFAYALAEFWENHSTANTLSFEAILHEPGSPGRVFLMDEHDITLRLGQLEALTQGQMVWSETAGLKQMIRKRTPDLSARVEMIKSAYKPEATHVA
jgi:hypothetical protein